MFAELAIPVYIHQTFTYRVPESLETMVQVGVRCFVPFGTRAVTGYIVAISLTEPDLPSESIKEITTVLDAQPVIIPEVLEMTRWIADYYYAPWGEVLKASLPAGMNTSAEMKISITNSGRKHLEELNQARIERSTKWQALKTISETDELTDKDLQKEHSKARTSAIIRELEREGFIQIEHQPSEPTSKPKRQNAVKLNEAFANRTLSVDKPLTELQKRVIDYLTQAPIEPSLSELLEKVDVTAAVIRTMERRGIVEVFVREVRRDPLANISKIPVKTSDITLTPQQASALEQICGPLEKGEYSTFLLHGVTGAGKTEIYLRAMRAALEMGKSAMMLVPEISLAPVFSRRLKEQFGDEVAILHSSLSDGERVDEWKRIYNGQARVVIGTRSAVFAPLRNLGIVVVDEEHETSYKQEETPRYNGRDSAIMRALKAKAVVVLGSATPSLESYHNAQSGKYHYIRLAERIGNRPLAKVEVVDMREVFKRHGKAQVFSDELKLAVEETISKGEQTIILLNRRGFSTFLLCRSCGAAIRCRDCDVTLTFHRDVNRLICHYCNFQRGVPQLCPACNGQYIYYLGEGTEQLEAISRQLFPQANIARLDRDTTRRRGAYERTIGEFSSGTIDLLIGTQIVAKGHDFPNVTLVGVVSVDAGLGMPDFRAAERTFQILTQVAGRAGRGSSPGKVIIQSYHPEHYSLQYAKEQDYQGFYQYEINFRRMMYYPPFSVLVNIIVRHKDLTTAQAIAAEFAKQLKIVSQQDPTVKILGPAAAPLARLKTEHRLQILIKARLRTRAREILDLAVAKINPARFDMTAVNIEVDPIDLL
ncbi:MAG: primosomal protein N' [Blastocatellia bacterium]|nr:primosomal protein N' [Blastocatellia bacterium]